MINVIQGDNLTVCNDLQLSGARYNLIYIDPPFNSGIDQVRHAVDVVRVSDNVDESQLGFGGHHYTRKIQGSIKYADSFDDYMSFITPRLKVAYDLLEENGSLFVHLDYREVHYVKVELDKIFGSRSSFINEIIWTWDYGAKSKTRWSNKHNTILWYAKNPDKYTFNYDKIDRIPYLAPDMVSPEKAALGKVPTTVWWHTIVSPTGKEKTGYPSQKPLGIIKRIVAVHSSPGDKLLDFFAGSGTLGDAAELIGDRSTTLIDVSPDAIDVMKRRFARYGDAVSFDTLTYTLPMQLLL